MRILIIRNFPSYMDVENNTYNIQEVGLAKALVRKGHICDIIFWTDKEEKDAVLSVDNKWSVHVFYRKGKTKLKNTIYTNCEELFENYDILQPCEYNQIQSWILAKKYPKKTIIYHGPYYSEFNKRYNAMCKVFDMFFLKLYKKNSTKFLVKSKLAYKFLKSKGINQDNICITGVGIDSQMLTNKNEACKEYLYEQIKKESDELKILYIGRFENRRNIPFILKTFKEICNKNSKAKLYMIGSGNKEYINNIWELAKELGIFNKIVWQEKMEQKYMSKIYKYADFFILPTRYEIFGMVLLEAMFYENIVLTTVNGGSSTLIKNGENGIVIDNFDSNYWAEKMLSIYDKKEKMNRIKKNASEMIKTYYTWDILASVFESQYRKNL